MAGGNNTALLFERPAAALRAERAHTGDVIALYVYNAAMEK